MSGMSTAVSESDRFATMLADVVARLGSVERRSHVHPAGLVEATVAATAPGGALMLDGSTVTGAQTLHPELWAVAPAAWKSGADLILPDARGRTIIGAGTGAGLTARTLGALVGVESVTLSAAESGVAAHTHGTSGHSHSVSAHTHSETSHSHSVSAHTHSTPAHTHGIDHGGAPTTRRAHEE
jgi:hypothetical protein